MAATRDARKDCAAGGTRTAGRRPSIRAGREGAVLAQVQTAMVHSEVAVLDESGNNSVVECDLAKVEVAGSNPVSRSNLRSSIQAKAARRSLGEGGPDPDRASAGKPTSLSSVRRWSG